MEFLGADVIFSFFTLTMLEIVLGIDNLIFIAIVVGNLPKSYAKQARFIGLSLAMVMRIIMLISITWIMKLTEPLFKIAEMGISVQDLLLIGGGVFLIAKSTIEMHVEMSGEDERKEMAVKGGFTSAIIQIIFIDFVFSFDSILTAVGLTKDMQNPLPIMISAVVISMVVMLVASDFVSTFLKKNPTFKMLALAFILMIGMLLVAEGLEFHIPRGYIYFSFAFSLFVEAMNTAARNRRKKENSTKS